MEDNAISYMMAVSCDQRFTTPTGPRRADELAAAAPRRGWQRLSASHGSKGHRLYDRLLRRRHRAPNAHVLQRHPTPMG